MITTKAKAEAHIHELRMLIVLKSTYKYRRDMFADGCRERAARNARLPWNQIPFDYGMYADDEHEVYRLASELEKQRKKLRYWWVPSERRLRMKIKMLQRVFGIKDPSVNLTEFLQKKRTT